MTEKNEPSREVELCLAHFMLQGPEFCYTTDLFLCLQRNGFADREMSPAINHMLDEKWIEYEENVWRITEKGINHFFRVEDSQ